MYILSKLRKQIIKKKKKIKEEKSAVAHVSYSSNKDTACTPTKKEEEKRTQILKEKNIYSLQYNAI